MNKIRLLLLILPTAVFATEPGYLHNDSPPPKPKKAAVETHMDMERQFTKAKGLTELQVQALHFNRVACGRKIYSRTGWSVEGDADLKISFVAAELYEAEFPSHLTLAVFDPYQNGFDQIESSVSRQLVNFAHWPAGRTLKLFKSVSLSYMDPNTPKQTAYAADEFKVIENSYPPTFIVKETIYAKKKLYFYFICQ